MPELPEVETTRRGIAPHLVGHTIDQVIIRNHALRQPIPDNLATTLTGQHFTSVNRRGKYLLLATATGTLIVHLGMSGHLRIVDDHDAVKKHDHLDIILNNRTRLRYHDPRRFGLILWSEQPVEHHPLLAKLGPEPLLNGFNGEWLYQQGEHRRTAIKTLIMSNPVVVGVGNIYANESLFLAGIRPTRGANRIARHRYQRLADAIRQILTEAIRQGGTTLRDFVNAAGKPGYFSQQLNVYGREKEPCTRCSTPIRQIRLGQRSTYYCPHCQR